jgi:hypothetical protein
VNPTKRKAHGNGLRAFVNSQLALMVFGPVKTDKKAMAVKLWLIKWMRLARGKVLNLVYRTQKGRDL